MMRTARCMAFTGAGRGDLRESWVAQLDFGLQALQAALAGLYDLAIGGTAAGKGLNAHSRFGDLTAHYIAGLTGSPFRSAPNKFFCPVRPRCPDAGFRGAAHLVRRSDEACQRCALPASGTAAASAS